MKIYNFSRVIAFPFFLWLAIVLYYTMKNSDYALSYWIIPPFIIIAICYIMAPQIDYWWLEKHPVPLDEPERNWLRKHSEFYTRLSEQDRIKYENRLSLFVRTKAFTAMGKKQEKVPEDVKLAVAHSAIELTLHKEKFMFGDMDRFIVYKHPFPSPRYQFLHTAETHLEDGVMILSLEHLFAACVSDKKYYHVGKHAFAEAFIKQNPTINWSGVEHMDWSDTENISSFREDQILGTLGFKTYDILPVIICLYFTHRNNFEQKYPRETAYLKQVFS